MMDDARIQQLYPIQNTDSALKGLYLSHDLRSLATAEKPFVYSNYVTSLDGRIAVPHPSRPGLVVPAANGAEAALAGGVRQYCAESLLAVVSWLDGHERLEPVVRKADQGRPGGKDLSDVYGQHVARRALEVAAAGAHAWSSVVASEATTCQRSPPSVETR